MAVSGENAGLPDTYATTVIAVTMVDMRPDSMIILCALR
jgi:hypothetical protein